MSILERKCIALDVYEYSGTFQFYVEGKKQVWPVYSFVRRINEEEKIGKLISKYYASFSDVDLFIPHQIKIILNGPDKLDLEQEDITHVNLLAADEKVKIFRAFIRYNPT